MSDLFYQCTRDDALRQQGLLGQGTLPYPEVIANRFIPRIDVGGEYATDELSGATILAANLADPNNETTQDEALEDLHLLIMLFGTLKQKGQATAAELEDLRKRAEAIPVVGPLLFSPSNLPGTLASVGGVLHATSQTKRLIDLLKVSGSIKREIIAWSAAQARGVHRPLSKAARKRGVRIFYRNGKLTLRVPAASIAPYYHINPTISTGRHIHVPAQGGRQTLNTRVTPDSKAHSARGVGRILTGGTAGAVLAFAPQAVMDARESDSVGEFLEKSAYSQVGNAAAFAAGAAVAIFFAGPAIGVIALGIGVGALAQAGVSHFGVDKMVGDLLTNK